MIVPKRQERDAVTDANPFGPRGDEGKKDLGRRRVRIFVEAVMLDLPDAVIAEPVRELRLSETIAKRLGLDRLRWVRDLHLVKQRKLHATPPLLIHFVSARV